MVEALSWTYPSPSQCLRCHTAAAGRSLGLETAQLERAFDYGTGAADQLGTLEHIGLFDAPLPPAPRPRLPDPDGPAPTADRARAVLHANCSFCHRPNGLGRGPADLRYANSL